MFGEYAAPVFILAGGAACLSLVFLAPPLTSSERSAEDSLRYQANLSREIGYCTSELSNVDCACFAGKAAEILSGEVAQVRGARYASGSELARAQAASSC